MITKLWIRRQLKALRRGLDNIDLMDEAPDDLFRFKRQLAALVRELYPRGSDFTTLVDDVLRLVGQRYALAESSPESPTYLDVKTHFRDKFLEIVNELDATVKAHGTPVGFRPSMWHQYVVGIVVGLIGSLFSFAVSYSLMQIAESRQNETQARELVAQAKIATSDFYRKLKDYDHHFKSVSFDSAVYEFQKRGTYGSGVYIGGMIRFAEEARRERDAMIDSCMVRIRQLGVNTSSLRYPRCLPIRMGQALKGRAEQSGLEPSALREVFLADTL